MDKQDEIMSQIPLQVMRRYELTLQRKTNVEAQDATTQTSQEVVVIEPGSSSKDDFEIESIVNHETKGKRMGVVFIVKRKGYTIIKPMRSRDIILHSNGWKALREYMLELQVTHLNRFNLMMKNESGLSLYLKEYK